MFFILDLAEKNLTGKLLTLAGGVLPIEPSFQEIRILSKK